VTSTLTWEAVEPRHRAVVIARLREKASIERAAAFESEAMLGPVPVVENQRAFARSIEEAARLLDDAVTPNDDWHGWAEDIRQRVVAALDVMLRSREASVAVRVARGDEMPDAAYEMFISDALGAAIRKLRSESASSPSRTPPRKTR
jgi:hypothetical protein